MNALQRALNLCEVRGIRVVIINEDTKMFDVMRWCRDTCLDNVKVIDGDSTFEFLKIGGHGRMKVVRVVRDIAALNDALDGKQKIDVIVVDEMVS